MRPITIQVREEHEGHAKDQDLYKAMFRALEVQALALRTSGEFTDHEIIAMSVRAAQQLAANATALADDMSVKVELSHD